MQILSEQSKATCHLKSQRKYNVFALPAGFSGCAFWRFRKPLGKLQSKDESRLNILLADNPDKTVRMSEIEGHIEKADIVAMQAPGHADALKLMRLYKREGKKVVVDYDDYSFDLSPGNPRYAELGTKECEVTNEKGEVIFRWKDQENGFDLKANQAKFDAFKRCVEEADLVTTTTQYLADKFLKINPKVAICPNSVDLDLWKPLPRPEEYKDQVRIGWFGGDSHHDDLGIFKTVIPTIAKKYKNVKVVMLCPPVPQWHDFFKDIPENQFEWRNWADLKLYTLFLAARHWDIGLCPLDESSEFNRCKSNIKYLEYSSLNAASICQNMIPYANTVDHMKNGLLASTEKEWEESLSKLIEDRALRRDLSDEAYGLVKRDYNLDKNCFIWEKHYLNLIEGN